MLQRVSAPALVPSTKSAEQTCQTCRFGTIVLTLWPVNAAAHLAKRAGCTKRAANFYINGKRKPSAKALIAILRELV